MLSDLEFCVFCKFTDANISLNRGVIRWKNRNILHTTLRMRRVSPTKVKIYPSQRKGGNP